MNNEIIPGEKRCQLGENGNSYESTLIKFGEFFPPLGFEGTDVMKKKKCTTLRLRSCDLPFEVNVLPYDVRSSEQ